MYLGFSLEETEKERETYDALYSHFFFLRFCRLDH